MKFKVLSTTTWIIALFLVLTATGLAQDYRGRIEGVVTDQTKAVIPGAIVTLLNVNTGVRVVKETTDTGLYLFDLVDPGTYSVTVDALFKRILWSRPAAT